jgi:hypothetical protein
MRVFISWSGNRSKAIASAFREWLPLVIQSIEPWMSNVDIDRGTRWDPEIATQLSQINFGLICLTPENRNSTAIHFEAGAISKTVDGASRLYTVLFELEPEDLHWPLSQFQHTKVNKEEVRVLLNSMRNALSDVERKLSESQLNELFDDLWPKLEAKLAAIQRGATLQTDLPEKELLKKIYDLVQYQDTNREMQWVFDRLKGPQAILYETEDGQKLTFEEAIDKFGVNRYLVNMFNMGDGFILVNPTLGVACFTRNLEKIYRKPAISETEEPSSQA